MKSSTLLSKKLIVILVLLISFSSVFAQPGTNVQKLNELSKKFKLKWEQDNKTAKAFAKSKGIPFKFETDEGILFELQSVKDGQPMYYMTENANAAATISTNNLLPGGSSGLDLDGTGITVHEWDGGAVLGTHQEYAGRVVMGDGVTTTHYHSTHVAGTMIASGVVGSAKGMAPNANLRAFDWNSDESEMATEAANGALFSNHSYGYATGWSWNGSAWVWYGSASISTMEDYKFGFYDSQAQDWDQIASDAPYYLIVKSAGNDRGDGPTNGAYPQDGPYDCIGSAGLAKNVLTVGAINDIPGGYSGSSSVVMSSFSSWGPADDGRIKPDISTNGIELYSSYNTNNSSYASLSGTSMAAPSATGSLVLLQQHYENLNGADNYMLAATLKALVIETADEAGSNIGPDYSFGWGLMNTEKAALKISENQNVNVIDELVLNNGESYTRTVHSNGMDPIKVTICWTELPGTPTSASLDPLTPMLVNDLDLRLTLGGSTFYSWKLDRDNPAGAATNNSENDVDNVEVVYIATPTAGDYIVTVDHDGTLSGGSQAFSIIYDGISDQSIKKGPYLIFEGANTEMKVIWQNNATSTDNIKWGTNTSYSDGSYSSTEYGTDHQHAYVINGLTPGTKYFYQVETTGSLYNGSFNTAPDESATSLKFLAYGDTRTYPNDHNLVAQEIISTYTADPEYQSVLISMGDLINDGNLEADWSNQFFETGLQYINSMFANIPYQSCMGNHEGNGILFQKYFPYNYQANRYYSFEYGPALFIVLDQYVAYTPGSDQYVWLENLLSSTTKAWKILYFHEPGWTASGGHENNANVQNDIQPLCEQYGVHITFAGHNHYYSRAEVTLGGTTVQHITTGGGGAPLRTPDPNEPFIVTTSSTHHFCKINIVDENLMYVDVVDKNGVLIDEFSVNQTYNTPPTISLTAPVDNTHYDNPQIITISANASDDGTIAQVEFFVDGSSVGTDNSSPYSVMWTPPANGAYTFTAKATDDLGAFKTSAPVSITVGVFTESVSSQISTGSDDAEESVAGEMYLTSTDMELVYDTYNTSGNQTVGLRFTGLGIPQGVTINSASIQFTADEATSETTSLAIFGHNSDDSPIFTTSAYNISSRSKTLSSVNWVPLAWNTAGEAGTDQQTPDLSNIIQEIVDRPAFIPSSAISLVINGTGKRTAEAYEGVAGSAAILNIKYSVESLNNPPAFTSDPIDETAATEDAVYSSSISDNAFDVDDDDLIFSKVSGPTWLTVANDGVLSGTPVNSDVGSNSWIVKVDDGKGGTDQAELEITVENVNDSPIFTSDPIVEIDVTENEFYTSSLADNASDLDVGDVLTFSKVALSFSGPGTDWLTVVSNGSLSGTPVNADVGLNSWTINVDDGNGGTAETTLQIEVIVPSNLDYCASSGDASAEYIESIQINGTSNTSSSLDNVGYFDYTGLPPFNLESNSSVSVVLTPGFIGRSTHQYWAVWIDYNINGIFESDELVYSPSKSKSAVSGSFTTGSQSGLTRMRISMSDSGTPSSCYGIGGGEVEDYLVQIGDPGPQVPVADFIADLTAIVEEGVVTFTNLSTNGPNSLSWSFPGGAPTTSTVENPSVTYSTAGTYDVSLTATNDADSGTETKTAYITVTAPSTDPPVADFIAGATSVYVGDPVQFTDLSTNTPDEWSWSFGDEQISSKQNPSISYGVAGTYSVALSAKNSFGTDIITKTDYIVISDPPVSLYCEPSNINNSLDYIDEFILNDETISSGVSSNGYSYQEDPVLELNAGSTYTFSLTPLDDKNRNFWRIWINTNNDTDFIDAGETLFTGNNKKGTVTGSITIPSTIETTTRLRITMRTGSSPGTCDDYFNGEVEDYLVKTNTVNNKSATMQTSISVDRDSEASFNAYPNPTSDKLFIHFEGWDGDKEIRLIDMTGRSVYLKTYADKIIEIDISSYPKGIYLLNVNNGIYRENEKIIIR